MRILITAFLFLFLVRAQAQDKAKSIAEAQAKMQALAAKMQQSPIKAKGNITYIVNGKTYRVTNGISTAIINGEIGDISDDKHTIVIGDGTVRPFKKMRPYNCKVLQVVIDGLPYAKRSKSNTATITFYDRKSIKGNFSGSVYNEQTKRTYVVSGAFELHHITAI
ncbi:hypothetical protein [Nubsella zeaxanthinifaciens]|uniref:hypothetical protein n=1 Tax=Nubsella zeaxanthinifaciens TaxID=392412 RepID=UPI000DE4AD6B|nr:hypothetical protein [Nubsella zeaxanthinifaciens]